MANKVTIDVEARFVDNITDESRSASKAVEGIGKSADKAQKQVDNLSKKKAKPIFDADDNKFLKKIRSMEAKMSKMGHTKTAAVLDVIDKATNKIGKVINKAQSFAHKTWQSVLKFKDSEALSSIKKVTNSLENITKKTWSAVVKAKDMALAPIKAIKNALFSIPTLITTIIGAKVVQETILKPTSLADQYTNAQIGFSTLLGDSRGKAMMDEIDAFAAATPFKTSNVISNVQKMMAYGWDAERVIDDMKTIGDAAASTGRGDEGLASIVYALSEIRTKGKLSTQELNQLASAGIKSKLYLAKGLGYGTDDAGLKKLAADLEDGAIGANQAIELILEGMKEFEGMMDRTANETVKGLKDQLADLFEINVARKWGQGLQSGLKKALGSVVGLIDGADDALGKIGDTLYELGSDISNWVATKFENAIKRIKKITDSYEFQNASAKEKISMLWNGVVADPVKEWWNNGGKEKVTQTAADVGKAIGKAILEGISVAWNALPWWGKLLVGGYAGGKAISGVGNVIGGAQNLFGMLGSAGGYKTYADGAGLMFTPGSGFLGGLSKIGYKALGGKEAVVGLSGGKAALAGGATIAGLAGAVISTGHALSTGYKAIRDLQNGDKISAKANGARALSTGVGLGAGALGAAGMAKLGGVIGTFFGGPVGTAVGAGLGGLVGKFVGGKIAKSIEASRYEHEGLNKAIKDGADEAKILEEHEKALWEDAKRHFGTMKLSTAEIQRLSTQIVWGDDLEYFEQFSAAVKSAEANMQSLKTTTQDIDRWMWKAGLGVKFNADEIEAFSESINTYLGSSKSFLENKQYEFTSAIGTLLDPESEAYKKIIEGGNNFFAGQQKALSTISTQLADKMQIALSDGIIELNEQKEITNLQEQIASIIEQAATEEFEADLELMKMKWGGSKISADSFAELMETGSTTLADKVAAADEVFVAGSVPLKKIFGEGTPEYNAAKEEVTNAWRQMIVDAATDLAGSELQIIGDTFANKLGTDAVEDLKQGLASALYMSTDPINVSDATLAKWLNIENIGSLDGATIDNLKKYLSGVYNQIMENIPDSVKKDIIAAISVTPRVDPLNVQETMKRMALNERFGIMSRYHVDTTLDITGRLGIITPYTLGPNKLINLTSNTVYPTINFSPRLGTTSPIVLDPNTVGYTLKKYRGGIVGGSSAMEAFARGGRPADGMLKGTTKFIRVNEESPEMIIPLSSQRRDRAMKLWNKTGSLLGVPGFARGGIVGGNDEGLRFQSYGSGDSVGAGQTVQVDVGGITFEINVNGDNPQSITEAIKAQADEIAEVVAGVLADALGSQFENTPARGGVA